MSKIIEFERSFASHPKAQFWSSKNDGKPEDYSLNSHKKFLFDCNKCGHEIEKTLYRIIPLKDTNTGMLASETKKVVRLKAYEAAENKTILECMAGAGDIWRSIGIKTDFKIDANPLFKVDYTGNALTYIKKNDVNCYGIIDIDTWGSPAKYINALIEKKYSGIVVCTYCEPISFNSDKILMTAYYGDEIYNSVDRAKLNIGADKLIKNYLLKIGVNEVYGFFSKKNNYFFFKLTATK
jgi:hypothetical protein